jgi:hypothetical protein
MATGTGADICIETTMGLYAGMAAVPMPVYGEPVTGNTGPNSMDDGYDFPPGKEFRVQE